MSIRRRLDKVNSDIFAFIEHIYKQNFTQGTCLHEGSCITANPYKLLPQVVSMKKCKCLLR